MDDDAPPPPYSLRDPYSPSPTQSPLHITAFNVSVGTPLSSPGSLAIRPSGQTLIPTPYSAPVQSPISPGSVYPETQTRSTANGELSKTGFVSAAPYFELRTPVQFRPRDTFYHHVSIGPDAGPDNIPFPKPTERWISRGVDEQDWLTFLNHLFPSHGVEQNNEGNQGLEVGTNLEMGLCLGNSRSRDQSRPLLGGSQPGSSAGGQNRETKRLRRVRIEAVLSQWNEGFFGPRGLEVLIDINNFTPPPPPQATPRRISFSVLQKPIPSEMQETLLHQAVAKGKKSHVKLLMDKGGEDMEALNKKGETALFRAVSRGDKDIVQLLLDNSADPNARPPGADSSLHNAVYHDRKSITKSLLERSRVGLEEMNSAGETPLYVAVRRRHSSCIEVLLENGANPNMRPAGQDSMLNMVVTTDNKSIAKLLLKRGVDVEEKKNGEQPMYRAASRGQTSMVKLLLEYGASAAARTTQGYSALTQAVSRGDKSIVSILLQQKDIDVEAENEKGATPLWTAISRGHTGIADMLLKKGASPNKRPLGEENTLNLAVNRGDTALVHLLLERGIDFEEKSRSGYSPLFEAVSRGDTSIISLLLGKGADANTRNMAGESVLQRALHRNSTSIISLLLGKGANPNLKVVDGENPLWQAVSRHQTAIVSILLVHGANPEAKSQNLETPLYRAINIGSTSIVSMLLSRGADPLSRNPNGETMVEFAQKRGDKTIIQLLTNYSPPKLPEKDLL